MKHLLYLLCTAALLLSCQKQDDGPAMAQEPQEFRFRTYIEEGGEVRPMALPASRALVETLESGYYLNTLLSTANYPTTSWRKLMWNVEMNRDGSYKNSTDKKYFWAENANLHTFIAYSKSSSVDPGSLAIGSDGRLTIFASIPHNPTQQSDFIYSENAINIQAARYAPYVDLVFKHRMSRVVIKLIGTGGAPLINCSATFGYTGNVRNTADITLSGNNVIVFHNTWHFPGTYSIGKSSFSLPGSANTAATAVMVEDLILLPEQSLAEGWGTVKLTYTIEGTSSPQTATVALPAITLETGKQTDILINVIAETANLSVLSVTLTDWNTKTGEIDKLPK